MQDLWADPRSHKLCLSVTDRRDFYHQLAATKARAVSNTLGPGVPVELVAETEGHSAFLMASSLAKKKSREARGDHLGSYQWPPSSKPYVVPEAGMVWVAFNSVLQGDHGGVEICTDAHVNLLQSYGLLHDSSRLVASRPLSSHDVMEGLVIDDYFCVS